MQPNSDRRDCCPAAFLSVKNKGKEENKIMPKTKFQEVIFTIIMVFVMVYAMICYNIVLNTGTMTNETFLLAFHELTFMGPIAFILDQHIFSPLLI